jgi:hypothetical protein
MLILKKGMSGIIGWLNLYHDPYAMDRPSDPPCVMTDAGLQAMNPLVESWHRF